VLEPIFVREGVVATFSGHEHFYERTKPQLGITHFISGGAGSLRVGDIRPSAFTEVGFDRDYHFMLLEISGQELFYQAISRPRHDDRCGRHPASTGASDATLRTPALPAPPAPES
jgi:hypothetical protein